MFGIGQIPTGDRDPFALRRHALGVIRMLAEGNLDLPLEAMLPWLATSSRRSRASGRRKRNWRFHLRPPGRQPARTGYTAQEVDAVVSQRPQRLGDIPKRLAAVRAFAALPEAAALAAANKRVGNILKKVETGRGRRSIPRCSRKPPKSPCTTRWSRSCRRPMPPSSPATTPSRCRPGRLRPGRCLLRRRHGQCRRPGPARQPPRPARQAARGDEPGRRHFQAVRLSRNRHAHKLVILDRDGVINFDSAQFIKNPAEWKPIPGSLEAIARLNQNGYALSWRPTSPASGAACSTWTRSTRSRQDAQGRGRGRRADRRHLLLSACGRFQMRLPQAQARHVQAHFGNLNIDLTGVPAIGDSLRDLQACAAVGCQPMLVMTGKGEKTKAEGNLPEARWNSPIWPAPSIIFSPRQKNERRPLLAVHGPLPSSGRFSPRRRWSSAPSCGGIWGYRLGKVWRLGMQWGVENLLGIRPKVIGQENMPKEPCVIWQAPVGLGNHGLAGHTWGAYCVFVLKKELLRVPLVGWGLAAMKMISIDRAAGKDALDQVVTQGRERLKQGYYVIIFPEGTRVAPGQTKRYKPGGAYLATHVGCRWCRLPTMPVNTGRARPS
jgi:1-acyl-sn-glycerol-3-phosphate acyltransferase